MLLVTHLRGAQPPFEIRPCQHDELSQLPIIETAADAVFPTGRVPVNETTALGELKQALDAGLLLVSTMHEQVVGFIAGLPHDTTIHLRTLAVHPQHGRKGIGTALVRRLLVRTNQCGYRDVTLTTFADLPFNGPFYERLGFRRLATDEGDARLANILKTERDAGMTHRIAMRRVAGLG